MAEQGDQRLNAIRQIVRSLFHELGTEDVDLQELSGEKSHWILVIVKFGQADSVFEPLAHQKGHSVKNGYVSDHVSHLCDQKNCLFRVGPTKAISD